MDEEYRQQLIEQLRMARKLLHYDMMTRARYGISCEPSVLIRIEEREQEISDLEARLGIAQPTSVYRQPAAPAPLPRAVHQQQVARAFGAQSQADVEHHVNLLGIHRQNLRLYREQARRYGDPVLAPPVTQHGIREAQEGIAHQKHVLRGMGVEVQNFEGEEA